MQQRETPDGDVHAAGQSLRDDAAPEPDIDEDNLDDPDDDVPTIVRPAIVNATVKAGRDAHVVLGDAVINVRN